MPDDLKAIVQRMIDAGESEENIATVIQHFQAKAPASQPSAKPAGETDAHGNTITRNPDGSVKTIVGPGYRGDMKNRPDSNVATIGSFGIAPEDLLMAPSIASAASKVAGMAGRAVRKPVTAALDLGAAALDNPIAGTISPRAGQVGKLLGAAADFIRPTATAAPTVAKTATQAAPAVAEAVQAAAPAAATVAAKAAPVAPNLALKAAKDIFTATGEVPLKAEVSNTMALIQRGKAPEEALRIVIGNRPAGMATAVEVAKKLPPMTAEEVKLGQSLMKRGKSFDEAMQAIEAQRAFKNISGVQSNAEARAAIDKRWASGQIKTPSAETAAARRIK